MKARPAAAPLGADPTTGGTHIRWPLVLGSVALAALAYLCFSLWAGWHDVTSAASRVGTAGVAILLGLSSLNYLLRFCRWQVYLRALGAHVPWLDSLGVYLAGFALTTTPGKAGETIRSVFLRRHGVPYTASIAAFVSERLSDLIAIVLLSCIGLTDHPQARPLVIVALVACAAVLLLLSAADAFGAAERRASASSSGLGRALRDALRTLRAAKGCHRPALIVPMTALSLLAWSCEALAFSLMLGWLGLGSSWMFAFFVYSVSMLAGALSFLPGGLGSTEAVMLGLLLLAGNPHADAVAATVLIRLSTLWFAVLLGLFALPWAARRHGAGASAAGLSSGGAA